MQNSKFLIFNPPPEIPGLWFDKLTIPQTIPSEVEGKTGDERGFGQRGREPQAFSGRGGSTLIFTFYILHFTFSSYAQEPLKEGPVIVNGDTVEYSTTAKEVTASGNVSIEYKGSLLTCEKITVNTETKDGEATGNVRLQDDRGVIEGQKATYNFNTKAGTIVNANFRSNPYFGKAKDVKKVNDAEFIAYNGYMSTCSMNSPHYRIRSKKIDFYPNDKVITKNISFLVGKAPLMYIPSYTHSMREPLMHVQLMPGKKKEWGPYMLSAWRYSVTDKIKGRVYLDFREKLGVAEGLGLNYTSADFGNGDYKYYYTQERSREFRQDQPAEFQRYLIRWRHKWDIDNNTNMLAEYYKIEDSKRAIYGSEHSFLKDYFFREFEKDTQPPSYLQLHRVFKYSSLDFFMQKRTNRWYAPGYLEKLPEVKYSLPSVKMGETPFYFDNSSTAGNYNRKNTSTSTPETNAASPNAHVNRLDSTDKVSLPTKVAFIQFQPFASSRQTFYDKEVDGSSAAPRTTFYSGADLTTKFYRVFNVKSNFLNLDVNGLRHIITPNVSYTYNHEPTVSNNKLRQIDAVDSLTRNHSVTLELLNKLQTKRKNLTVDFATFKVNSIYYIKPKTGDKLGSNFSDITFDLELMPYSWMRFYSDATYKRSGDRQASGYNRFSTANYDLSFSLAEECSIGLGQRYQRKGGNEITNSLNWRVSPKWKFSVYQRRNIGHDPALKRGLREQEYTIARDLHCWEANITYNVKRGEGESIWLIFRLKAFPEMEFAFNQSYHAPKSGSQSNP